MPISPLRAAASLSVLTACLLMLSGAVGHSTAEADSMDIALARLRIPCPPGSFGEFCADNGNWRRLMSQFGSAVAPPILSPARTLGYKGFYFGVETWVTALDSSASYWQQGTEGDAGADAEGRNRFVNSTLVSSRLAVRKAFPFGLELGASMGHPFSTDNWIWGLEVKWALFEGYRTGFGMLPDVAVRGMLNTVTGDSEYILNIPSFDVTMSKPLTIAGAATLTPFAAWQLMWIMADSELVDLTPDVDAFAACRPQPGPPEIGDTGTVRCTGDRADYNNNVVFERMRAARMRLAFGLQGNYQRFTGTASVQFDLLKPGDADNDVAGDLPRQWTVAFGVGLNY